MKISINGTDGITLTPDDTNAWAHRPGETWPYSTLAGKALTVSLDIGGDIVDIWPDEDVDSRELTAMLGDLFRDASADHDRTDRERVWLIHYAECQRERLAV